MNTTYLYPEIEPRQAFYLPVSPVHSLYVEELGNPQGVPVVFLHGGPGGGFSQKHRRLFDPAFFRIILFDQRGAGQSTPHACLEENTTWHLVEDIKTIQEHFNIPKSLIFGGSWGSTLALAFAETYSERVLGLILRGIFLCRPEEIHWFYQEGCSNLFPDLWSDYVAPIPISERHDMVNAYYKRLTDNDPATRLSAAKAWSVWEGSTCKLVPNLEVIAGFEADDHALAMARIECHYFVNQSFFTPQTALLANAHTLAHIPTWIIHGRYDVVCPVKNAWDLKQAIPHAQLNIVPDAGHAYDEPGIAKGLYDALEAFKQAYSVQPTA